MRRRSRVGEVGTIRRVRDVGRVGGLREVGGVGQVVSDRGVGGLGGIQEVGKLMTRRIREVEGIERLEEVRGRKES